MIPLCYVDLTLQAGGKGAALPAPVLAGAALRVLHGAFKQHPGRFALALPGFETAPFAKLRIFAANRDDLDRLVEATSGHNLIKDYMQLGYPRKVSQDFDGAWLQYSRYRIPSRKSGRHVEDGLRQRRMDQADQRRLPYFILSSQSTGQQFGLYVAIDPVAVPVDWQSRDLRPDSYGLSVSSRAFALPDLP
jgi:CRISPR-associated endoribonuclease Cas6/Csy4 subtype I-F